MKKCHFYTQKRIKLGLHKNIITLYEAKVSRCVISKTLFVNKLLEKYAKSLTYASIVDRKKYTKHAKIQEDLRYVLELCIDRVNEYSNRSSVQYSIQHIISVLNNRMSSLGKHRSTKPTTPFIRGLSNPSSALYPQFWDLVVLCRTRYARICTYPYWDFIITLTYCLSQNKCQLNYYWNICIWRHCYNGPGSIIAHTLATSVYSTSCVSPLHSMFLNIDSSVRRAKCIILSQGLLM